MLDLLQAKFLPWEDLLAEVLWRDVQGQDLKQSRWRKAVSGLAPTACCVALEVGQLSLCASFCPDPAAVAQT